jgi:excinuclease ABC subunit C
MVTFINGIPEKNFYRRFKIKFTKKPSDVDMIKEILERRFRHEEWGFPDLILIDGGIAQLNVALKIKNQKSKIKKIKVISLAKRENKLYIENRKKPVFLKNLPREIFNLILNLDNEAHRFAISYHKKLREKSMFEK